MILAGLTGLAGRGRPSPQQGHLVGRGWRAWDPMGGWDAMAGPLTGTPPADQCHQNDLLFQRRDSNGPAFDSTSRRTWLAAAAWLGSSPRKACSRWSMERPIPPTLDPSIPALGPAPHHQRERHRSPRRGAAPGRRRAPPKDDSPRGASPERGTPRRAERGSTPPTCSQTPPLARVSLPHIGAAAASRARQLVCGPS